MRHGALARIRLRALAAVGVGALCAVSSAALGDELRISQTMSEGDGPVRTITFVIDNMNGSAAVRDYRFTETLDDGFLVASPSNASTTCTGGIVIALPGTDTVDYEGGTVPANTACSVRVDVHSDTTEIAGGETGAAVTSEGTGSSGPLVLGLAAAGDTDTQADTQADAAPADTGAEAAGDFIEARREEIATRDADLSSRDNNRLSDDAKPLRVRAQRSGDQRVLSVTTSLRRLISGAGSIKVDHNLAQEGPDTPRGRTHSGAPSSGPLGFDLWGRGSYVRVREGEGKRENAFAHLGADYRFAPGLAVGILQQVDVTEDENPGLEATSDGWGWMVGPYVAARLPLNLLFDARAAWGESYNSVVAADGGAYSFDARRLLVRGQLSADYAWDALHFRPLARILYYDEAPRGQDGSVVPEGAGTIARLQAGYEITYDMRFDNGLVLTPRLGMRGTADYAQEDVLSGRVADAGASDISARIEAALRLRTLLGWSLDAGAYYDGIGSVGDTFGGEMKMSVPLN